MRSILEPDRSQAFLFRDRKFQGTPSLKIHPARVKPFTGTRGFTAKTWTGTRPVTQIKPFADGARTTETKTADTTPRNAPPEIRRAIALHPFPTETAPKAEPSPLPRPHAAVRPFMGRGKSQEEIDREQAAQRTLTIDEVRELLNRND